MGQQLPPNWGHQGNAPQGMPPGAYGQPPAGYEQPITFPKGPPVSWYHQIPVVVLSLLVCWPVGLIFLWGSPRVSKPVKVIVSTIYGLAFLFLFGMSVVGARVASSRSSSSGEQVAAETQPAAAKASSKQEKRAPRQALLNEPFRLGKFTYTVTGAEVLDTIGRGYGRKKASDGASFIVVHYTIVNEGNKTETVMSDDFQIVDAKGRQFRPSSEANTALMMSGKDKDFILSELQPGIPKSMATAFEVPNTVLEAPFQLVIPEKGFLGTDKVIIGLQYGK